MQKPFFPRRRNGGTWEWPEFSLWPRGPYVMALPKDEIAWGSYVVMPQRERPMALVQDDMRRVLDREGELAGWLDARGRR